MTSCLRNIILVAAFLGSSNSAFAIGVDENGILFRAGSRATLNRDIEARTVPLDEWNKYVMGQTHFDLPEFRKGLYGAETFAGVGLYLLYKVLDGQKPWISRIHVKKSCLTRDSIFNSDYTVGDESRFSRWYLKYRSRFYSLESECLHKDWKPWEWEQGALYDIKDHDEETQRLTALCAPVIDQFLKETNVKLAFDLVNDQSWYIRDRDCIECGSPVPAHPRLDKNGDNQVLVKQAFSAAVRAIEQGRAQAFQLRLKLTVDQAISSLGAACHGGKGVRTEFKASCDSETIIQSEKLLQSLRD